MPTELLPGLVGIVFVAAVVQGAAGFGFGLVSVAGLSLVQRLVRTTPFVAVLNLPVTFYVFWKLRRSLVWRRALPVVAGLIIGAPFGIFVLVRWPQGILMRALAVVLLVAAAHSARPGRDRNAGDNPGSAQDPSPPGETLIGFVVGLATGALAGAFNTGGPPGHCVRLRPAVDQGGAHRGAPVRVLPQPHLPHHHNGCKRPV